MQTSLDIYNYMETLVEEVLFTEPYIECFNSEQRADLACLALAQLRPLYIRHNIDLLMSLPEEKLIKLKNDARIAIEGAQELIINDRRKDRSNE